MARCSLKIERATKLEETLLLPTREGEKKRSAAADLQMEMFVFLSKECSSSSCCLWRSTEIGTRVLHTVSEIKIADVQP